MAETKISPRVPSPAKSGRKFEAPPPGAEDGKRVNVKLSEEEHTELKILAIRNRTNVANVIRGFVREYLKKGGVSIAKAGPATPAEPSQDS
jgi:hypothetical protein